ncbi:hypothetical protein [Paramicrobacterium agarici]|uniref:hypothetical protein n=1 Tax=Paramicrobacterium agarici TaxID=630514 RepID=UPI001153114D|nr:hypothetical protein [Microbacterium agarici]TQO24251.1 hypothetical protein FB385_3131 [Microbacterium agarici]
MKPKITRLRGFIPCPEQEPTLAALTTELPSKTAPALMRAGFTVQDAASTQPYLITPTPEAFTRAVRRARRRRIIIDVEAWR